MLRTQLASSSTNVVTAAVVPSLMLTVTLVLMNLKIGLMRRRRCTIDWYGGQAT